MNERWIFYIIFSFGFGVIGWLVNRAFGVAKEADCAANAAQEKANKAHEEASVVRQEVRGQSRYIDTRFRQLEKQEQERYETTMNFLRDLKSDMKDLKNGRN